MMTLGMTKPTHIDGLEIVCVDDVDALDTHAAAWDALAARQGPCIPMFAHAWVSMLFRVYGEPGDASFVLFGYDGDDLVGVLPVSTVPHRVLGFDRPRARIRCDYHTEDGDVLLERGREAQVLRALLTALRRKHPNVWRLELGCVRDDSPTAGVIDQLMSVAEPEGQGSCIPIQGDAETWASTLSKSLRRDIRRGENKIKREEIDATYQFLGGDDADPAFLDEIMALETSGWKGKEGTAIASDAKSTEKHRYLAKCYAAQGRLEWHVLRLNGRLAAAHFAIRMGESVMLLKQAFEDELSKYHVGHLLLKRAIEREFERGEGHEFNLVTDWPWCRRWGMAVHPYQRVSLYPGRPLAKLLHVTRLRARAFLKRVPGIQQLKRRTRGE